MSASMSKISSFGGFEEPSTNYFRVPHAVIDLLAQIETVAELKVILYIMRHTWGYNEYNMPKRISLDEFCNGRRRKDRTRMDAGCGMTRKAILRGIRAAVRHGFVISTIDPEGCKSYYLPICTEKCKNGICKNGRNSQSPDGVVSSRHYSPPDGVVSQRHQGSVMTTLNKCSSPYIKKKETIETNLGREIEEKQFSRAEEKKSKKIDPFFVRMAKLLQLAVQHFYNNPERRIGTHAVAHRFRILVDRHKVERARLEQVLTWYAETCKSPPDFLPQMFGARSVTDKWEKLESAFMRDGRQPKQKQPWYMKSYLELQPFQQEQYVDRLEDLLIEIRQKYNFDPNVDTTLSPLPKDIDRYAREVLGLPGYLRERYPCSPQYRAAR